MPKASLRSGSHAVFSIQLHIVFVTKYRAKALTEKMMKRIPGILRGVLEPNNCELIEFNGEPDHIHLLIDLHPSNNISNLVGSMKSATSRILRREFKSELDKVYWNPKAKLWHDSKCIVSCGGAPLAVVKQYIENQSGGRKPSR